MAGPDPDRSELYVWRNLPVVGGGFVTGIVTHPCERGLMYARTDVGGAYRWDAGAERWLPITDFIGQRDWRYTGVESIAIDPSDPERVLLALGIYNRPEIGNGAIARSNDRGRTWTLTAMPFGMGGNEAGRGSGERLAVDPCAGQIVFFGSRDRGLWKSEDGAESFSLVSGFPIIETALPNPTPGRFNYLCQSVGIVFVLFDARAGRPGEPTRTLYAGVSTSDTSLFRSTDGGLSWQPLEGQPGGLRPIRAALAADGMLYVTYGREPGPNTMHDGAVFRFEPESGCFTDITPLRPVPGSGKPFGYAGVAVDAADPAVVMVTTAYRDHARDSGGDEVFRSRDRGASWAAVGQAGERDASLAPWLGFGSRDVHVGHWMYAFVIDPFDPDRAYYGTGQTIWGSTNLTAVDRGERPRWRVSAFGIEETVPLALASPREGAELLAGTGDISGFAAFDLDDRDRMIQMRNPTFKDTTGIDWAEQKPSLVVRVGSRGWNRDRDRDTGAVSEDGGKNWRPFPSYPEPDANCGHVAVAADGASVVWAPRGLAAHVTPDLGETFAACQGLPEGELRFVADRRDPLVFYAFERATTGLSFVSRDGGRTFSRQQTPLPKAPLGDVVASWAAEGELWAALGGSLYHSIDGGEGWAAIEGPERVSHVGLGAPAPGEPRPTLFFVGELGGEEGFFRSSDDGRSFFRVNDDSHRFGEIRAVTGDPKCFGRLYVATGGRGLLIGEPPRSSVSA